MGRFRMIERRKDPITTILRCFDRIQNLVTPKNTGRRAFTKKDARVAKNTTIDSEGRNILSTLIDAIENNGHIICSKNDMDDKQWTRFKGEYLKYLELCQKHLSEKHVVIQKGFFKTEDGRLKSGNYYINFGSKEDMQKFVDAVR